MPNGKVTARRVRYIKLGRGGRWEAECLREGIVRLGYQTQLHFDLCSAARWDDVTTRYEAAGQNRGVATGTANQIRSFFEDDGETLWVTFHGRLMWWTFIDPDMPARIHTDGDGTFRTTQRGWRCRDAKDCELRMANLSGKLTKVAAYQRTVCEVKDAEYVLRRVNAELRPEVEEARRLAGEMQVAILQMIRLLTPQDFELLVDLVFSTSGWRRQGIVGGTEKTVDMELILPSTGEVAFVQVKSATNQREFEEEYQARFAEMQQFAPVRMFFVYHTGAISCSMEGVTVIDPLRLAKMVLDAGLVWWLIDKVA